MSDLTEDEKKWVENELMALVKAKGPETPWRCAVDPKSRKLYFFNKNTKETTWQMPEELKIIEASLIEQVLRKRVVLLPQVPAVVAPLPSEDSSKEKIVEEPLTLKINATKKSESPGVASQQQHQIVVVEEKQVVVDEAPVDGEEEKLLELLSRKDSILEPDTIRIAQRLIKVYKQAPKMIIDKLAGTYSGYPQMCKILLDILGFAQSLEGKPQASIEPPERLALDHFVGIAKQRFNKKKADEILLRYTHTPSWLKDMIHNEDSRELLSELNMKHRDSKFLRICTKEMNALGYGNKHSPLLIASELDNVHKFYSMFSHLTQKCLQGDDNGVSKFTEDLILHCKADKALQELCKYESLRLIQVIRSKDASLAVDDEGSEPASKRIKTESSSFLYPERLQRVYSSVSRLLEACNCRNNLASRKPLDANAIKNKLQSDHLLQALVNIVENQHAAASDMNVVLNTLGLSSESTSVSQSALTGSYFWCSKHLASVLLDSYASNPSQVSLVQVIATSSLISDLLPHVLDDACSLAAVPGTFLATLEALNMSFTFIRWRDGTHEAIITNLPKVIDLTKDISSMLYGTIDREKVEILTNLVGEQRVFAQLLLRLLTNKFSRSTGKNQEQSVNTSSLVSIWAQLQRVIVSRHPLLNADVLSCVEIMLDTVSKSAESEDDLAMQSAKLIDAADAKKDLLEVLVAILKSDHAVEDACHYLITHADNFDAVTVRHIVHAFLVDLKPVYWQRYAEVFVDLLSLPVINRAISNVHFRKDALSNLRLVLDSMPSESLQETAKAQELIKLVCELLQL